MAAGREEEYGVMITHFANPQLFWFHKIGVTNEKLENEMLDYYSTNTPQRMSHPKVSTIVAVRCYLFGHCNYMRAKVLSVVNIASSRDDEYIVWSLDHGFPLRTKGIYIYALPADPKFAKDNDEFIHCGGLTEIYAAEKVFNFTQGCGVMTKMDEWHRRACEMLEKLIKDALSVTFVKYFCNRNHLWGDLRIINKAGDTFSARKYLIALNFAIEAGPNFYESCLSLKAIDKSHYLSGMNKMKVNVLRASEKSDFNTPYENYCDSKAKIEDWCVRNENAAVKDFESAESCHEDVCITDDYDTTVDDSVSVRYEKSLHAKSACTDSELQYMGLGGFQRQCRIHKYSSELLPPKPTEMAFKFDANQQSPESKVSCQHQQTSTTPTTSVTGISLRKQQLMEKRKNRPQQTQHIDSNSTSVSTVESQTSLNKYQELMESTFNQSEADTVANMEVTNKVVTPAAAAKPVASSASSSSHAIPRSYMEKLKMLNKYQRQILLLQQKQKQHYNSEKSILSATTNNSYIDHLIKVRLEARQNLAQKGKPPQHKIEQTKANAANDVVVLSPERNKKPAEEREKDEAATQNFSVLQRKVAIDESSTGDTNDFTNLFRNKPTKQISNEPLAGVQMVPAGFDLTKLCRYKDEQNHWHRKKTTLNVHIPHDEMTFSSGEFSLNTNNITNEVSIRSYENNNNNIKDRSSPNNNVLNQNFRHTRPNNDKYKNIEAEIATPKEEEQQHINDLSLSSSSSSSTKKRRQLSSPTSQMRKIDSILRNAQLAVKQGNTDILNMESKNSSSTSFAGSKTDSDSTGELLSADDCNSNNENNNNVVVNATDLSGTKIKTSNIRALVATRLKKKAANKTNDDNSNYNKTDETRKTVLKELTSLAQPKVVPNNNKQMQKSLVVAKVIKLPQAEQLNDVEGEQILKTKFIDHLVLAHSKVPLRPVDKLINAHFPREIYDEMVHMRITEVYRIQTYAWPHLMRGNSLFIVNPSKTGKTWCYLPPICSLNVYRPADAVDTFGPVTIILVASIKHVEYVSSYCRRLLRHVKSNAVNVVSSFGLRNFVETKIQLLNSCGILVATPSNLLRLLNADDSERLFDPNRLQQFVIDDIDMMLARSQDDIETAMKSIFKMRKTLQLVVTSHRWNPMLVPEINRSSQPLLLIGDFLEAAVYGRAAISIKLRAHEQKIDTILRFIKKHHSETERLLIMCYCDADVNYLLATLNKAGHVCIGYCSQSSAHMRCLLDEWKTMPFATSQILICTDNDFPELQVQNVQNLIHYSMPMSWTKFTTRFSALAKIYENDVSTNFAKKANAQTKPRSLILLDKENNIQLPRLVDFMKKHNQEVDANIIAVSECILSKREEERIHMGAQICPYFLEFGNCDETLCDYRHNLRPFDAISKADDIPTVGDMRIALLKVYSPTHYTARLLKHKLPNSKKWHNVRHSNELLQFSTQLNLHYSNISNQVLQWPLNVNDLCIYKTSNNFERARVLDVPQIKYADVVQQVNVTIKLIDSGTTITSVKSDELYVCDDKFKEFPAQAIDIRLTGVIPYDNERTWDLKATKSVQSWIMEEITVNKCVHVRIDFALANTIWVTHVIVMEVLTMGDYIHLANVKRSLIKKNYAMLAGPQSQSICDIAEKLGLINHFDDIEDDISADFESCNLNDSIQNSNDSKEQNWDDAFDAENEVHVPLSTTTTTTNTSNNIPNGNKKSTIENAAKSKEKWCDLPLCQLSKIEIGDENENGNWNDIYVQRIDDASQEKFEQIIDIINQHVEDIKKQELQAEFHDDWFKPMQNCIVKYNDLYLRAKLYGIYGGQMSDRVYCFFLCDYACFVKVNSDEIYRDFLYETTQHIIDFMPYQAVHCTLAGIELDRFANRLPVTKSYLYAYPVRQRNGVPYACADFKLSSYEILLYECETNNFENPEMLNKALVHNGVATFHPETKHYLDLEVNINVTDEKHENEGVVNFEELIKRIYNAIELEAEEQEENMDDHENIEKLRKTVREEKAICAAAIEKERNPTKVVETTVATKDEKIKIDKIEQAESLKVESASEDNLKSAKVKRGTCDSDEEEIVSSSASEDGQTTSSVSSSSQAQQPPPLLTTYRRPQTVWYETDFIIYLNIYAPDIDDYTLEVTADTLFFAAIINGHQHTLLLNFLGTVEPQYVSHEIRGLNVVVRLVKSIYMKWPRLLKEATKLPWLKYNLNAINTNEMELLLPQQNLFRNLMHPADNDDSDTDADDNENNLYQNFTPMVNCADIHDPLADFM